MRLAREDGSALVLAVVAIMVIVTLAAGYSLVSVKEVQSSGGLVEVTRAYYVARAGISAGAHWLSSAGGAGDLTIPAQGDSAALEGQLASGACAPQALIDGDGDGTADAAPQDGDGDGFPDYSARAWFLTQGGGTFEVRILNVGANRFLIQSRGVAGGVLRTVEALVERVAVGPAPPFRRALFGRDGVDMDSNVMTDSYDSTLARWQDTPTSGGGNPCPQCGGNHAPTRNDAGDVGSNGDITMQSNVAVHGDATPGPGQTVLLSGNAAVSADTAPAGQAELHDPPAWTVPGLPEIVPMNGGFGVGHKGDVVIEDRTVTVGPGKYVLDSLFIKGSGQLVFSGVAGETIELWIDDLSDPSGEASLRLDANDLALRIAHHTDGTGPRVVIRNKGRLHVKGNSELHVNSGPDNDVTDSGDWVGDPVQLQYYSSYASAGDSDPAVTFDSNGLVSGVFYAPEGLICFDSNTELWGAVVGGRIEVDSNYLFHYDESLAGFQPGGVGGEYLYRPETVRELR